LSTVSGGERLGLVSVSRFYVSCPSLPPDGFRGMGGKGKDSKEREKGRGRVRKRRKTGQGNGREPPLLGFYLTIS